MPKPQYGIDGMEVSYEPNLRRLGGTVCRIEIWRAVDGEIPVSAEFVLTHIQVAELLQKLGAAKVELLRGQSVEASPDSGCSCGDPNCPGDPDEDPDDGEAEPDFSLN